MVSTLKSSSVQEVGSLQPVISVGFKGVLQYRTLVCLCRSD